MTMGPPQAEDALRMTLAMGVDRAVHLCDKVFAVADTLGTSRTLAMALEKEGADLVLCGRKTVDSETWQVPPEVAAFLGCPQLTNVDRLELAAGAPARPPRDRRGLRHLRAAAARRRLRHGRRERGHLAAQARRRGDGHGRAHRRLGRHRPRRRGAGVRQALRPDRLADTRAGGQGRHPGASRRDRGVAPSRPPSASSRCLRKSRAARPRPGRSRIGSARSPESVRLLDGRRARRRRSAPCLARAARQGPRAGRQARGPERSLDPRPAGRRRSPRGRALRRRARRRRRTTSAWPSTTPRRTPPRCARSSSASGRTRS